MEILFFFHGTNKKDVVCRLFFHNFTLHIKKENLWDVLNIGKTNILCYRLKLYYFINLVHDKNMIEEFLSVLFFLGCNGDSNSVSHAPSRTHPFP